MSILQEILVWTQGLPAWQSDAVARLLAKQTLTADDQDDLFALLKLAHGIADPKGHKPKPLTADQIPAPVKVTTHIELIAMKNMRHVNAIAENQHLAFSAAGMTLIYGDNGSGKSGYSRVLKRACRARDQAEAIHPNAHLPTSKAAIPEAAFEITLNGVAKDVLWTQGKAAPPELSSFAIFDSRCARAYLDSEDDFSYVPYGLDVFEALAKVCKQLKTAIDTEHAQSAADLSAFVPLQGDTPVGKLIASLSAKTTQTQIDALATEAAHRQVIVFTHDIYFLCLLVEEARLAGVAISTQSLVRRAEGFGVADPELPFEGKNASKRIGALKAQQQTIARLHKDGDDQEHRRQTVYAYFRLRMTWERAVEEVLLREVVLRFRKGVETQRLAGVVVDDEDYAQVNAGMTKCSNYAHDKALQGGASVPDPYELLEDITALETWRVQIDKRSLETAKKRKAAPGTTTPTTASTP